MTLLLEVRLVTLVKACLASLMTSDSLEKASKQVSFRAFIAGLPSFHFWQG